MRTLTFIAAAALSGSLTAPVQAGEFTGDVKLACEAILCLSTGSPPSACTPSLKRYFSIDGIDFIPDRIDFLNLCPSASQDNNMHQLIDAIANGAGRCDVDSLNLRNFVSIDSRQISNQMPRYCTIYLTNQYTDLRSSMPVYVGVPYLGGFWTLPSNYQDALNQYNTRLIMRGF